MNTRLALLAAALMAVSAPAFAGDDPCKQLAQETGLSERKINMILGTRSSFAEYPYTYERSVAKLRRAIGEGRYDILVNTWYNDSRTRLGAFSKPYLVNRIRLLRPQDTPLSYRQLADLYDYSIAVVRDYAYSPEFDADARLHKVAVRNFSSAVRMLAAGRVDLTVEDEFVARYSLQREPKEVREAVTFVEPALGENNLHILVSLKHPHHQQIIERFDRAIAAMKADGSYARLLRQHGF